MKEKSRLIDWVWHETCCHVDNNRIACAHMRVLYRELGAKEWRNGMRQKHAGGALRDMCSLFIASALHRYTDVQSRDCVQL